jgi:hypothetical protein
MSMYFLDETDDWPEYKIVRDEIQRLEKAHTVCNKELQEARVDLRCDPANEDLKVRIDGLEQKLKEIEKKLDESLSMYR